MKIGCFLGNLMIINTIKTLKLTKNRRFWHNFVSGQTDLSTVLDPPSHSLSEKIRGGYVKIRFFYSKRLSEEN